MRSSGSRTVKKSELMVGFGCGVGVAGGLSGLVQGSQQVTALEEVQVALQRHIDLAVVTGQLWQTGGLKRRAEQAAG